MSNERTTIGGTILSIGRFANLDEKYGPYQSKQEAYDTLRADGLDALVEGLTVGVFENGAITEYWFKNGVSFNNLVKKGVANYSDLEDKPTINNVTIEGNLTGDDLGLSNKIEKVNIGRISTQNDTSLTITNKTVRLDFSTDGGNLKIIDGNTGSQIYNLNITPSNNITGLNILNSYNQPYSLQQNNKTLYLGLLLDNNNDLAVIDKNNSNHVITTIPIGNYIGNSIDNIELNGYTLDKLNKEVNIELSSTGNGELTITSFPNTASEHTIETITIVDPTTIQGQENAVYLEYSDLYDLKSHNNLVPGTWYIITDYTCVVNPALFNVRSVGWIFGIMTLALTSNSLSENAYAVYIDKSGGQNNSSSYFSQCNLSSWKLKYCFENDSIRFNWAINEVINKIYSFSGDDYEFFVIEDTENYVAIIYNGDSVSGVIDYGTIYYHAPGVPGTLYSDSNLHNDVIGFTYKSSSVVNTGKGVIYWMQDEHGNEAPYDFKNIQFKRYEVKGVIINHDESIYLNNAFCTNFEKNSSDPMMCYLFDNQDFNNQSLLDSTVSDKYIFYYTFSFIETENNIFNNYDVKDASVLEFKKIYTERIGHNNNYLKHGGCFENKIYPCYYYDEYSNKDKTGYQILNNIVLCGTFDLDLNLACLPHNNIFGPQSAYCTIGFNCYDNNFGSSFCKNLIASDFFGNRGGSNFMGNILGDLCSCNVFGNNFINNVIEIGDLNDKGDMLNVFGDNFDSNILYGGCIKNKFENNCHNNVIENGCFLNNFGCEFNNNIVGKDSVNNTIFNNVEYTKIDSMQSCQILSGVCGTSLLPERISLSNYEIAGMDSNLNIKIWNPADLVI